MATSKNRILQAPAGRRGSEKAVGFFWKRIFRGPHIYYSWILIVLFLAGCQLQEPPGAPQVFPVFPVRADHIEISHLADRLGLQVIEQRAGYVKLQDSRNYVTIFKVPKGQVYVNGQSVGLTNAVITRTGRVLVLRDLESRIRKALIPLQPIPPRQEPSVIPQGYGTVMIDPGHGGKDTGAIGVNGFREKHVNLGVSKAIYDLLRQRGYAVRMTRDRDAFINLDNRVQQANRWNPQLFVSIHADSIRNRTIRGFTIYIARGASAHSIRAANSIETELLNLGIPGRGIRRANYRVLKYTRCPAVLVELGYLTNPSEATLLANPEYQQKLAQTIAVAIGNFLNP